MPTTEEVQSALRKSDGFVSCVGVIGPFRCGACGTIRHPNDSVGGVNVVPAATGKPEHVIICRGCYDRHVPRPA